MTEILQIPEQGETWQKTHKFLPVPNESIRRDVLHYAALCLPDRVHWCDGTEQERQIFRSLAAAEAGQAPSQGIIAGEQKPDELANRPTATRLAGDDRVRWEFPRERTLWAYGPGYDVQTLRRILRQT